jgi:uncharacterized membrane protein YdjX (TVP38/TMEM64 family)
MAFLKMKFWKDAMRVINIAIIVLIFTFLIYSIANYSQVHRWSTVFITSYGLFAIFVLSLFFDLFPQYLSAHALILIAAGLNRSNLFLVSLVVLGATFIASVLGFAIGKYMEEGFFEELFGKENYRKIEKGIRSKGKWYVAISAVSPLPYIPILFGAWDMDWKEFFIWGISVRLLGFIVTSIFAAIVF